jgi:hypothetical protein
MTKQYRYILMAIITLLFAIITFEYIIIDNQRAKRIVMVSAISDDFHENIAGVIDNVDTLYIDRDESSQVEANMMLDFLHGNIAQLRTNIKLYSLLFDDTINLSLRFNGAFNAMIFDVMNIDNNLRENGELSKEDIETLNEIRHDIILIRDTLTKDVLIRTDPDEIRSLLNTMTEDLASSEVRRLIDERTYAR